MNYTGPQPLAEHIPYPSVSGSPQRVFHSCSKQVTHTGHGWDPVAFLVLPFCYCYSLSPEAGQPHGSFGHHQKPDAVTANHNAILTLALPIISALPPDSSAGLTATLKDMEIFCSAPKPCWCSHATVTLWGTRFFWWTKLCIETCLLVSHSSSPSDAPNFYSQWHISSIHYVLNVTDTRTCPS